jgi:hypothetical protein
MTAANPRTTYARAAAPAELSLPQGTPPQLISAIEDAIHDALNRHGAVAFEAPREVAIFHEVGHAIVGTHEGIKIREITISSTAFGQVWGGRCLQFGGTWTTGPDTSADDDLHRARMIIAGLAAEALTGTDRPGSSLDELALSQLVGINAAVKLGDPTLNDEAHLAYVQQLWHERVWRAAVAILRANRKPFFELAECLNQKERVRGWKLHKILAQMERITL